MLVFVFYLLSFYGVQTGKALAELLPQDISVLACNDLL